MRRYIKEPHADAFAMLPADFHDVVFTGLASYGEHFPSTKVGHAGGRSGAHYRGIRYPL